jgi:uncharacterized membrane protein
MKSGEGYVLSRNYIWLYVALLALLQSRPELAELLALYIYTHYPR